MGVLPQVHREWNEKNTHFVQNIVVKLHMPGVLGKSTQNICYGETVPAFQKKICNEINSFLHYLQGFWVETVGGCRSDW